MKNKFNIMSIIICAVFALGVAYVSRVNTFSYDQVEADIQIEENLVGQNMDGVSMFSHTVDKVYVKGKLIGIINNKGKLDDFLKTTYKEKYSDKYPNSSLNYSTDVYFAEETSYFYYEDKDQEIMDYLLENELFSIKTKRVEFSNGAVVYCSSMDDFEKAKDQYLLNYVDYESLVLISNNQLPPELTSYGERIIDIQVGETYIVTDGYANLNEIKTDVKGLIEFFSYGYGTEMQYHTTEEFDTVEWVAMQHNLTAQQLITLNSDILKSETQLLSVGTELNVTFFNSPISVIVTKERIAKEVVYAEGTIYKANSELREGVNKTVVEEEDGSKNVYYHEVYVNGVLSDQEITREDITKEPVREVVQYGTKVIPGVGTGKFRWPTDSPHVSCHWGCYNSKVYGYHTGVDITNTRNRYGPVRAADRGTIEEVGYHKINGYYVYINHNNGYRTYYGHMKSMCYYKVGVNVEKGEVIGQIGMTGAATGPHIHFVIYTGKTKHDACKWLGC